MSSTQEILERLQELIEPLLTARGVELVDLELARPRRGRSTLRLYLDRPGGITLEEIARVSRVVGELLDVHDLIPESYNLEVSSPGLTRPLKKPADYQRCRGKLVRLTTHRPWEGRQVHLGILEGLENDQVCVNEGGRLFRIPFSEIARARLDLDLKNIAKGDKNLS
jgi:ribosome maturation factor RimP